MKALQLSQGTLAIVDDDVHDWVRHWNWSVTRVPRPHKKVTSYARRKILHPTLHKSTFVYLHKLIAGVNDDFRVVFRDNNPLNLQRDNLSILNGLQQEILWDGSRSESLFVGVVWDRYHGLWRAEIEHLTIGYFTGEFDAALSYNIKATEIYGASAELNNMEAVWQRR